MQTAPSCIRVIDLETGGNGPDDVCEIGWQDLRLGMDGIWRFDNERGALFVNPGRPMSPDTIAVPVAPNRVLIEDTYYSDGQALDWDALHVQALDYAHRRGWTVAEVERDEAGVLLIALGGDIERYWEDSGGVARSGLRAALFRATTGYSLPDAVRLAERIAATGDLRAANLHGETRAHSIQCWRAARFYRLLDRLLFKAAEPDRRYSLLERFYHFSPDLVSRFYAGRSTLYDKTRVLSGKPPVPIFRALGCLREPTILATAP